MKKQGVKFCLVLLTIYMLNSCVLGKDNCPPKAFGPECTNCTCDWSRAENCSSEDGTCLCKTGLSGKNCDIDTNECFTDSQLCGEYVCVNTFSNYSCECPVGYVNLSGVCEPCPNTHFGLNCTHRCTCHVDNTLFCDPSNGECICQLGWEGQDCGQSVDDCKGENECPGDSCQDRHLGYECICNENYMIVKGECLEYAADMVSANIYPAIGEFVDIYIFFSLPELYYIAPPMAPNFHFKVSDDESYEDCWLDYKYQSKRITGKEHILTQIQLPTNQHYQSYVRFRRRFFKEQATTVTAISYSIHKTLKLVFHVKYKSMRVKNCLEDLTIPNTDNYNISNAWQYTYKSQDYLMFEIHIPPNTACFESPRVIWDYYRIIPNDNATLCLVAESFIKLNIDFLTKMGNELLLADHHQHKEIITKNTLPIGTVMLCVTAYVYRSLSTKVISCGVIQIIPAYTIEGLLTPVSEFITITTDHFVSLIAMYKEVDFHSKLNYTWTCVKPKDKCKKVKFPSKYAAHIRKGMLPLNATYEIELRIFLEEHPETAVTTIITIAVPAKDEGLNTNIGCIFPCQLVYKRKHRPMWITLVDPYPSGSVITWTLTVVPVDQSKPSRTYTGAELEKVYRINNLVLDNGFFLSRSNVFLPDCRYTLEAVVSYVKKKKLYQGRAVYSFVTERLPVGDGCSASPSQGQAIITKFTITCKNYRDPATKLPLSFKLYQEMKGPRSKKIRSLVAYSNIGKFTDVTLSADSKSAYVRMQVEVTTMKDSSIIVKFRIKLITGDQADLLSKTIEDRKTIGTVGSQEELRLVKDVATVMKATSTAPPERKKKIRKQLMKDMRDFEAVAGDSIEHSSSVLTELAVRNDEVDEQALTDGLHTAERITKYLGKCGGGNFDKVKDVAGMQVSAINHLVKISSKHGSNMMKKNMSQIEKNHSMKQKQDNSKKTLQSLSQITSTLRGGFDLIDKKTSIRIKRGALEVLVEAKNLLEQKEVEVKSYGNKAGFSLASKHLNYLGNGSVETEYEIFEKSPFTGTSDQVHGQIPVVKVNFVEPFLDPDIAKKNNWQFSKPADVFLKNKDKNGEAIEYTTLIIVNKYTEEIYMSSCILVSVKASMVETTVLEIWNDYGLTVKAKARYTNSIAAFDILTDNDMIDIPLTSPGFHTQVGKRVLTRNSRFLFLPRQTKNQIDRTIPYYRVKITIKRGQNLAPDLQVQEEPTKLKRLLETNNLTMNPDDLLLYNMTIYVIPHKLSCVNFDEKKMNFSFDSCELSVFTNTDELHCRCVTAGAFSASYLVAPRLINPLDIELFLEVLENPLVVSMVIALWIIFLALFLWGRRKDRSDEIKRGATLLEDNKVDETYIYMLCVVTGNSSYAGTSSNVFLFLKGSWGQSDVHILKDNNRSLFESGAQNWFVLTTESDLGYIESAVVWTDFSGGNPSWFLFNIYVQNVQTGEGWNMRYNSWLSVVKGSLQIITEIPAVEDNSLAMNWINKIAGKGANDLRNKHLWFGMIYKSAHDKFTRFQRLVTGFSMLQALMILNLSFFSVKNVDDSRQFIQVFGNRFHLTSIIIGLECCAFMTIYGLAISFIFTRIKPKLLPPKDEESPTQTSISLSNPQSFQPKDEESPTGTTVSLSNPQSFQPKDEESLTGTTVEENINQNNEAATVATLKALQKFVGNDSSNKETAEFINKFREFDEEEKKEETPTSPQEESWFSLPWWFMYFYWGFLGLFNVFIAYYIMLYGLSLGYEKSLNWAVSFFSGFTFDIFVAQPIKVLGMVLFLVLVLRQSFSLKEEAPFTNAEEAMRAVQKKTEQTYTYGRRTGSQKHHIPPNKATMKDLLDRLATEMSAREMLRDLLLYSIFLSAILMMIFQHSHITMSFRQTEALNKMLFKSVSEDGEESSLLDEISTVEDIWNFAIDDLIPFLDVGMSDNLNLNSFYFVGTARLRQVRMQPDNSGCDDIPHSLLEVYRKEHCSFSIEEGNIETRDFNQSWSKPKLPVVDEEDDSGDDDEDEEENEHSRYSYRSATELKTASIIAPRYAYPGGGYVVTLPRQNVAEAVRTIKKIGEGAWIDRLTRCLLVEFTIYNPDANLFTYVVVGFEFDIDGGPYPFKIVSSSRLYHYKMVSKKMTETSEMTVAVCTAFYSVIVLKKMLKLGLKSYFAGFWNWIDVIQLALIFTLAVCVFLRDAQMVSVLSDFALYGNNYFLDFQAVFDRDYTMFLVEGLIGAVAFLKLNHILRFNPFVKTFVKSMDVAVRDIGGFVVMTMLYTMGFAIAGRILFGNTLFTYMSMNRCLLSLLFFLLGEADYPALIEANRVMGQIYFLMVLFVTQYIIINFFLAMIRDGFDMARSLGIGKKDATLTYMLDTLKLYMGMGSNRQENLLDLAAKKPK